VVTNADAIGLTLWNLRKPERQ